MRVKMHCYSPLQSIVISESVCLCLSVCMSVSLSTYISRKLLIQISGNFLYILPVAVAWSSSDEIAIRYVLTVLWLVSCFHVMASFIRRCCLVEVARWQHGGRRVVVYNCKLVWLTLALAVVDKMMCETAGKVSQLQFIEYDGFPQTSRVIEGEHGTTGTSFQVRCLTCVRCQQTVCCCQKTCEEDSNGTRFDTVMHWECQMKRNVTSIFELNDCCHFVVNIGWRLPSVASVCPYVVIKHLEHFHYLYSLTAV